MKCSICGKQKKALHGTKCWACIKREQRGPKEVSPEKEVSGPITQVMEELVATADFMTNGTVKPRPPHVEYLNHCAHGYNLKVSSCKYGCKKA